MDSIEGVIKSIVFRNLENAYTVLTLAMDKEDATVVGTLPFVREGERLSLSGTWTQHATYGKQFKCEDFDILMPDDALQIERYLASGVIRGIGEATARQLVEAFGGDTLTVLEQQPERLLEIPGFGQKRAMAIAEAYLSQIHNKQVMLFMHKYEIPMGFAIRILKVYGENTIRTLRETPYRLVEDVPGIGFRTADRIAMRMGIAGDDPERLSAGLIYALQEAAGSGGHVFLPRENLVGYTAHLLNADAFLVDNQLDALAIDRRLVVRAVEGESCVYLPSFHFAEGEIAQRLLYLKFTAPKAQLTNAEQAIIAFEEANDIAFDAQQRQAILMALTEGICLITGGPGTGKTTIINCILSLFVADGVSSELCAPTGRAAKRLSESTGAVARTIHRMLEYSGEESTFQRDADAPMDADAIIVDEMSMVDQFLMCSLLRALKPGTRLIMVGDADQLPSVGAGNVLSDLLQSDVIPYVRLSEIFRQAAQSLIIQNAHRINRGEMPVLQNRDTDFFFEQKRDPGSTVQAVAQLVHTRLPNFMGLDSFRDIQVLSPMRKGETGVNALNQLLQTTLNPPSPDKRELSFTQGVFRQGDKIMQTKNNYQTEWVRLNGELGQGIFNGEMGIIQRINPASASAEVLFDDERLVTYEGEMFSEIELAYAISVHKSQGSEFPAVVLPLFSGPPMLMVRNLLYTAVTRARRLVVIVGREGALYQMVQNDQTIKRFSGLKERLWQLDGQDDA